MMPQGAWDGKAAAVRSLAVVALAATALASGTWMATSAFLCEWPAARLHHAWPTPTPHAPHAQRGDINCDPSDAG